MSQLDDPRIPAAFRPEPPGGDPLKHCVFTTLALLAWVAGPIVVTAMAALGLVAYVRALRRGQRRSRCLLRDARLVVAYLAAALVLGVTGVIRWLA